MTNFFIKPVDSVVIIDLLKTNCVRVNNYYIFDTISFRKGEYNESIKTFIEHCKLCYKPKYHFYLNRKLTAKSLLTIMRQICNNNNIIFTNEIKYSNSTYETIYKFWVEETLESGTPE
jgi:hypothetical protein